MSDNQDDSFNASRAEVFEALGHPTRIRLLQCLSEKPLSYSELKRAAGLESNGLLSFHLGKLAGLVKLNPEGAYALTDEGRDALRIVEASRDEGQQSAPSFQRPSIRVPHLTAILACLVVVLIVLASVSVLEYTQIQGLDSRPMDTGVSVNGNGNATLYSGTASTPTSQGTAHVDLTFVYTTASVPIPIFLTATSPNGTSIPVYQCQSATSCTVPSIVYLKPFTGAGGMETLSFYFGSAIVRGMNYTCSSTVIALGGVSSIIWGPLKAQ